VTRAMHGLINKGLEQPEMPKNYCRGKRKVKQNGHETDEDRREGCWNQGSRLEYEDRRRDWGWEVTGKIVNGLRVAYRLRPWRRHSSLLRQYLSLFYSHTCLYIFFFNSYYCNSSSVHCFSNICPCFILILVFTFSSSILTIVTVAVLPNFHTDHSLISSLIIFLPHSFSTVMLDYVSFKLYFIPVWVYRLHFPTVSGWSN